MIAEYQKQIYFDTAGIEIGIPIHIYIYIQAGVRHLILLQHWIGCMCNVHTAYNII